MKADTIVVPIDFSEYQQPVLDLATSLARASDARLVIVHVADPARTYGESSVYAEVAEPQRELMAGKLRQVRPHSPDVDFEHRYLTGTPADAIVDCAKELNADYVVMGTHGRTGISRVLMGSVAEAVVREAPCPVMTIKTRTQESNRK
jgi:universal stress protein A